MSTPKQSTDETAAEMKERLEEFDKDIAHLRDEADELEHKDEGPRFYESGDTPQDDDQNASPA